MAMHGLGELAYHFRANNKNRPVLLLGAGASYRSGIPLAADAVKLIARAAFARHVRGVDYRKCHLTPSDWLPYLQKQKWFIADPKRFAENFPLAVEHFLFPREFRREFFLEMVQAPNGLNDGYRDLAQMMQRRLCWTILTTNFDRLLVHALKELHPHVPEPIEVNRTADDLVRFATSNRCQVVYLHGAVEFYRDKNLIEETEHLDEKLLRLIRPLLSESPLIVIGYRGAERSVMHDLFEQSTHECANYRHGIYWCIKRGDEPHENVLRLKERLNSNFRLIEIDGFDEILAGLNLELEGEAFYSTADDLPLNALADTRFAKTSFDRAPMEGTSLNDLDHDLILATLTTYCNRLRLRTPTSDECISLLLEQGLVVVNNRREIIPTKGGYLLFGRRVNDYFPYASVAFTREGKRRTVFQGNLMTQWHRLIEALSSSEVNPTLRVKSERSAEEKPAYPQRAMVELVVNMLVHRDYTASEYSRVDLSAGEWLRFSNPGGLLPRVLGHVRIESNGRFQPVRSLTELRNPVLADIFYGLGSMDKEGTGLVDVHEIMLEHGGSAEFQVVNDNQGVCATLIQPRQGEPESSRTARRLNATELFVTNLLPFRVIPGLLSVLPLRDSQKPLFVNGALGDIPDQLPIVIQHGAELISFADLGSFPEFADRVGHLDRLTRIPVTDYIKDRDARRRFVWLLGKHWEFFLRRTRESGLFGVPRKKRAYFQLLSGDPNVVVYESRSGRSTKREVVKQRGEGRVRWYENEGIFYSIVNVGDQWAVQLKPLYVFTGSDGVTPLPAFRQTRLATRRMKFDRNRNVDDDLTFWARFLSKGVPAVNLGGVGVEDLILDFEYTAVEVPVGSVGADLEDQDSKAE